MPWSRAAWRVLSVILSGVPLPGETLEAELKSALRRPIEMIHAVELASPGATRNQAIRISQGEYVAFARRDVRVHPSFLEQACRVLDEQRDVGLVSAWYDGVPLQGARDPRPCTVLALLARPWLVHLPQVWRREPWAQLGGFDETMVAGEELDLALRALSHGVGVVAIEEPFWSGAPWSGDQVDLRGALAAIYERHRTLLDDNLESLVVAKERVLRELANLHRAVEREWRALDSELAEGERERSELQSLLSDPER
jgi:hypothetical protein